MGSGTINMVDLTNAKLKLDVRHNCAFALSSTALVGSNAVSRPSSNTSYYYYY